MKGGGLFKEIGEKWRGMTPEERARCVFIFCITLKPRVE